MTQRYGIDASILVRLVTGEPVQDYDIAARQLTRMVGNEGAQLFASNMVIGDAYTALQHHYGVLNLVPKPLWAACSPVDWSSPCTAKRC